MKTSELSGAALDWAVLMAEGWSAITATDNGGTELWVHKDGKYKNPKLYHPSNNWMQGGPIIEREKIGVDCDDQGVWFASYDLSAGTSWGATGTTPLTAAMRCYVASKLGDEVQIPEGL